MNILIIKLWAIGDILMATPMLDAIRAAEPGATISWLVDSQYADILANHPKIDEVIPLETGSWRRLRRQGRLLAWMRRTRQLQAQMRERHFDAVINCQAQEWWSYFLCAAPRRVGLFPWPHKAFLRRLYSQAIVRPRLSGLHNTDHFLQATQALGFAPAGKQMSLGETPDEQPFVDRFWHGHGLDKDRPTVALAPLSTSPNRSLSALQAARIADWLAAEYKAQVLVTCGPNDADKAAEVVGLAKGASGIVMAQTDTLRQYIALLRRADLVISADSSAMHLAAALGTPFIALFGPTPSGERAPLEGRGVVIAGNAPCAPCDLPTCANKLFQECMKSIALAHVQEAVKQILGKPRS